MHQTSTTTATQQAPARPAVQPTAQVEHTRNQWGALRIAIGRGALRSKYARAYTRISRVLGELATGDVDEHRPPAWQTGIAWDTRRDRGEAVNCALYGLDIVAGQALGVVQIRQCRRHKYGTDVRKNWFLVGRNETTGRPFAHPVSGRVVQNAVRRNAAPESAVTAARAWLFEVPEARLPSVIRHGDVALVPVARPPAGDRTDLGTTVSVVDSHVLMAEEIAEVRGRLYARRPLLQHLKGQHADVSGRGWHRIQVGLRAAVHPFARPTAD